MKEELEPGTILGNDYVKLIREIKSGGMGSVWEGEVNPKAYVRVAIRKKELDPAQLKLRDNPSSEEIDKAYSSLEEKVKKELIEIIDPRLKDLRVAVKLLNSRTRAGLGKTKDDLERLLEQGENKDQGEKRFSKEYEVSRNLRHKNIISSFGGGYDVNYGPFFLMELERVIESEEEARTNMDPDVKRILDPNTKRILPPYSSEVIKQIALELIDGLEYAHGCGIIHRDIKPGNVMLCESEDGTIDLRHVNKDGTIDSKDAKIIPKIGDFGLVKEIFSTKEARLTTEGKILGTPSYISPEQAEGKDATTASDVYSLCATLYYFVCGKPAFAGDSAPLVMAYVLTKEPVLINKLVHTIPKELALGITAGMSREPGDRPTLDELRDILNDEMLVDIKGIRSVELARNKLEESTKLRSITRGFIEVKQSETPKTEKKKSHLKPILTTAGLLALLGVGGYECYEVYTKYKNKISLEELCNQTITAIKNDENISFSEGIDTAEKLMENLSSKETLKFRAELAKARLVWSIDQYLDVADQAIVAKEYEKADNLLASTQTLISNANPDTLGELKERFDQLKEKIKTSRVSLEEAKKVSYLEDLLADIGVKLEGRDYTGADSLIEKATGVLKELPENKYLRHQEKVGEYFTVVFPKLEAIKEFKTVLTILERLESMKKTLEGTLAENKEISEDRIVDIEKGIVSTEEKLRLVENQKDAVSNEQYSATAGRLVQLRTDSISLYAKNMEVIIKPVEEDYKKLFEILKEDRGVGEEEVQRVVERVDLTRRRLQSSVHKIGEKYNSFENRLLELKEKTLDLYVTNLQVSVGLVEQSYRSLDEILKENRIIDEAAVEKIVKGLRDIKTRANQIVLEISTDQYNMINDRLKTLGERAGALYERNTNVAVTRFKTALDQDSFNLEEAKTYLERVPETERKGLEEFVELYNVENKLSVPESEQSLHEKAAEICDKIGYTKRAEHHKSKIPAPVLKEPIETPKEEPVKEAPKEENSGYLILQEHRV